MKSLQLAPPTIQGLHRSDQELVNSLMNRLARKYPKNRLRRSYYDYKATLNDLGISIPPSMQSIDTVLGWASKGVDALTRRVVLNGFRDADGGVAGFGLVDIWEANRLDSELPQAFTSAAVTSPSFLFVHAGDVSMGEPAARISARPAEMATGVWDERSRSISAALSIESVDHFGAPTMMVLYTPGRIVTMRRDGSRVWELSSQEHGLGMPVEPLVYRPMLGRPFGFSRITPAAMSLIDSAVRTLVRSEVSAEFFSAPQRYVLGASQDSFVDEEGNQIPVWSSLIGRFLALSKDEDGDTPSVGQFSQQSMEPHLAQVRQLASLFAAEMSMTPRSFGIMQDNPESADAIQAAKEDLVMDARAWQRDLAPALKRTMVSALRLVDDSPAAVQAYSGLRPHWMNAATPSVVSSADAFSKIVGSVPSLATTRGGLEMLGFDDTFIDEQLAAQQRANGAGVLAQLANRQAG